MVYNWFQDAISGNGANGGSAIVTYEAETPVSLRDMLADPQSALPAVQRNLMANWQGILVSSFFTAFAFKTVKKVLRGPIAKVNTGLFGKRGILGNVGFKL